MRRAGAHETLISPCETKRFAGHGVSHWNPYGRRISHFAGLFVFNDLTGVSFRRFLRLFVFSGLAPLSFAAVVFLPLTPRPRCAGIMRSASRACR